MARNPQVVARRKPTLAAGLLAALAGLAAMNIGCAAAALPPQPGSVYVSGAGAQGPVLVPYDALALSPRPPLRLPGPVVAAAYDARRQSLYLLLGGGANVLVAVDPLRQHVQGRWPLGLAPTALALAPRGSLAYVVGSESGGQGRLLVMDLDHGAITARLAVGPAPIALALDAAGSRLLIANRGDQSLSLVQLPSLRHRRLARLASPPAQVLGLPFGDKAFVLCQQQVAVVDMEAGGLLTYLPVGPDPQSMALKPDGGEIYVSNAAGTVSVLDTDTNEVSGTMAAGLGAGAMAVAADGSVLYVANAAAGTVGVIDLSSRTQIARVRVGEQPASLLLDASGHYLFVADRGSNDVAVVRGNQDPTNPDTLVTLLPSPSAPQALAVAPGPSR